MYTFVSTLMQSFSLILQVRQAAWAHMRLGGIEFLPVDRSSLMALLVAWSAFPHIMVRAFRDINPLDEERLPAHHGTGV